MSGEKNMETYIIICKIDSQQEIAVWLRKQKKGLCTNLEGWVGEVDGKGGSKRRDICIPILQSNNPSIEK